MRHLLVAVFVAVLTSIASADDPGGLTGRVLDAATGVPIAGALVQAGGQATLTDSVGLFRLTDGVDSLIVTHVAYHAAGFAATDQLVIRLHARMLTAPEIVVRAGLTRQRLGEITASVDVVSADELAGQHHLQDLTDGMANMHWAGGTSRPRYFQIRGIGERSQYAGEGPPSFAVGFVVDDVELSGLGTTAMLFDMEQVEIFKGPQSTVFGPDAMAGLISMRSVEPGQRLNPQLQASLGGDGLAELGAAVNLPLTHHWRARLSYGGQRADGYRDNVYLNTDDSNGRREQTLRAKLQYKGGSSEQATLTLFRSEADNGYDAWSPDNNTRFTTYSDQPGRDEQTTTGGSLRLRWPLSGGLQLLSITSASTTDVLYSYDSDWANDDFWAGDPYRFDPAVEGWSYDFFDSNLRQRTTWTQEGRLLSARVPGLGGDGVVGFYAKRLREQDDATGYLFGGDAEDLDSEFDIDNLALYTQWQRVLSHDVRLLVNLRADRHGTQYRGVSNGGADQVRFDTQGWLTGGRLALSRALRVGRVFAALSRGYRPGGVNQHPRLSEAHRPYDAESVWNAETGLRATGERGHASITLFYAQRRDQHVELSSQQDPGDPNSFVYFTANAATGRNAGAEAQARYRLTHEWSLHSSAGWLSTHTQAYSFDTAEGERLTLGDREAAHAPSYSLRVGADYDHSNGAMARLTWSATDGFFYSDSHDQQAAAQQQLHGSVGYRGDGWSLRLWGRNLLDERYTTRGFYFGLEPPAYEPTLYVTHGDPRQIGITLRADLGSDHGS
ncbi:MAG: TonB-dependent receptor [Gemmatimonadetes bacterium]|jgi:iron complex outermembrane recepter protein|nr:TonB-dependent receptor [Gemmatimonadota bacterium]MBT6146414.1 TonB-dependent receptor [Gemmatimonadota bacterium]MBT7859346.1 TonB-dependent receptor [Gemmatimonadota bacterium]